MYKLNVSFMLNTVLVLPRCKIASCSPIILRNPAAIELTKGLIGTGVLNLIYVVTIYIVSFHIDVCRGSSICKSLTLSPPINLTISSLSGKAINSPHNLQK